jgi:two-component system, OmpR family, sensor histidine kinase NblS
MKVLQRFCNRWHHFHSQIRSLAFTILVISLISSSFLFISFSIVYKNTLISNVLIIKEVTYPYIIDYQMAAIDYKNNKELKEAQEDIYLSILNLKYIILADSSGEIINIFPENLPLKLKILNINMSKSINQVLLPNIKFAYRSLISNPILDFRMPIFYDKHIHAFLCIGLMPTYKVSTVISFLCLISSITFIIIWLTSIMTVIFNAWINTSSIQKLSTAMQHIMIGNFNSRINPKASGALAGLINEFNEMAERLEYYDKKNINQLILEKAKLETLVSIIADGALLLDKDLRIIFINNSALQTFKFLQSCLTGTYIYDYFPSYINKQLLPILNQISQDNYSYKSRDFSIHLDNDLSKTFQFIVTTVIDQEHQATTGIGIIIKDITSQIGLNEAKSQFISNVSHELRTPLFNIRSFLETLSEYRHLLTEEQKIEFLEIASQETQRLTDLVNDVLDLSRLESDFRDSMEIVELYDIVPAIIQTSQLRANQKHLHLSFSISEDISCTSGYTHLLIQVLSNLIGNSLKFTPVDGRIFVKAYPVYISNYSRSSNVETIRVEIIDEGNGIKEFDQGRIYDRFVRLENNVHTLEGTGLGLSIVKNIILKHNSRISLYSEFGLGSSFWFDLCFLEKKS